MKPVTIAANSPNCVYMELQCSIVTAGKQLELKQASWSVVYCPGKNRSSEYKARLNSCVNIEQMSTGCKDDSQDLKTKDPGEKVDRNS